MDTMQCILQRYSCRNYHQRPVESLLIDQLIRAAEAAPVACGRYQDLQLTVITDPVFLQEWDKISAEAGTDPAAHPLYGAGTLILVSSRIAPEIPKANPYLNAGIVAQNVVLAAENMGLSTVILAYPVRVLLQSAELLKKLQLPAGFEPAVAVAVGWTDESKEGRAKVHHMKTVRME